MDLINFHLYKSWATIKEYLVYDHNHESGVFIISCFPSLHLNKGIHIFHLENLYFVAK